MTRLMLASGSAYRRELLARLGLPFESFSPAIDESPRPGEAPKVMAGRLAEAKAGSAPASADIVIGSDQVASLDGQILGKPGDRATALAQLTVCQSQTVEFWTATAILDQRSGELYTDLNRTRVTFAQRSQAELERYLDLEPALDCAGSFKAEGLGIALFQSIESTDPTGLIGLPLIRVAAILRQIGMDPLAV